MQNFPMSSIIASLSSEGLFLCCSIASLLLCCSSASLSHKNHISTHHQMPNGIKSFQGLAFLFYPAAFLVSHFARKKGTIQPKKRLSNSTKTFFILFSLRSELLFTTLLKKSRHFFNNITKRNGATLWPFFGFSSLSPFLPS